MTVTITDLIGSTPVKTAGAAAIINTNFDNLNDGKLDSAMLDTATDLASNSDTKIPSQKAVRTFVLSGGQANASETERGLTEEATDAEVTAGTATGATGAKLFTTPTKLKTILDTRFAAVAATFKHGSLTKGVDIADSTVTITHGLGLIPKIIRVQGAVSRDESSGGNTEIRSNGTYIVADGTYSTLITSQIVGASATVSVSTTALASAHQVVTVSNITATTMDFTLTRSGIPFGTELAYFTWQVEC